jgi:serine/threonine-protein kinase SRPK3
VSQLRPCQLYLELDRSSVGREERFVAIKIMTGFASKNYQAGKADEIGILKKSLSATESQKKYAAHIVRYYDNFTYTGPTSVVHNIIVTEPLAHSLQELQNTLPNRAIPLWLCKHFAKQVLQAISYLHEACGVVYGGEQLYDKLRVEKSTSL